MDDSVGIIILVILAIGLLVAAVIFLGMILLGLVGASAGVGALSGLTLSVKAPFTYLSHMWKRCR